MKKLNSLKSVFAILIGITLVQVLVSCGGDDTDPAPPSPTPSPSPTSTLSISPSELFLSSNADAKGTFTIASTSNWIVSCQETWISLSQKEGTGNGSITVTATSENPNNSERTATISVSSGNENKYVTVKQAAPDILTLSGLDAPFDASAGSIQVAQELSITCNGSWTISGKPDWLDISALSGNGNSNVKVWTNSANNSTSERRATLTVTSGGKTASKEVIQRAGFDSNLQVTPKTIVALADGFAFDYNYGSKVKYYYVSRYLPSALDRKTDEEIIAEISSNVDNRDTPSDGYVSSWKNQNPSTEYVVCIVGYDQNGNHGALTKTSIKTKSATNQALVTISEVKYNDTYWLWTTSVNGFVTKYYQWFIERTDLLDSPNAAIAWFFNDAMNRNPSGFQPIAQGDTWQRLRNGGTVFHLATWALDVNGNFSGIIDRFAGSINSSPNKVMHKTIVESADASKRYKTNK